MINAFSKLDALAVISMIAGIGGTGALSAFGDSIETLAPGWGKKTVAFVAIVSFAAGLVIRTMQSNQNAAVAQSTPAPVTVFEKQASPIPTSPAPPEGTARL